MPILVILIPNFFAKNWIFLELFGDDVKSEVLDTITKMYNEGKRVAEIDEYLLNEELCTQDEREFIIENITNYINMENQNQDIFPNNLDTMAQEEEVATVIGSVIIGTENAPIPVVEEVKEEKQKRQWTRRVTDGKSPVFKPQSAEDFIKVMQEKIEMARMLDAVTLPEISGSMTKGNRDIMVEFQKEHAQMVSKYMERIQKA